MFEVRYGNSIPLVFVVTMETRRKKDQYISNLKKYEMIFVKYAKRMHILKVVKNAGETNFGFFFFPKVF